MNETFPEYEKFLTELNKEGIAYAVTGGFAVCLNGYVRVTEDVDILVEDSPENLQKLIDFLGRFGEGHGKGLQLSDFTDEEGCIRVIENFPIDIFTKMEGKKFADFDLMRTKVGENIFPHLTPQALIELKKKSWRDRDQLDVSQLQKILKKQIDENGEETPPSWLQRLLKSFKKKN